MILVLPETARSIVDNGSMRAHGINRPLIPVLVPKSASNIPIVNPKQDETKPTVPSVNPIASLQLVRLPGTALMLLAYAAGYSTYSCLQASLSSLFLDIYDISGLASGLIYIPFGVACALSAFGTGALLDRNYRKTARESRITITKNKADDLTDFPIEKARLRTITWLVVTSACLIASYGWQLQERVSMAGPLVTQFFVGLTLQTMFTAINTLLVDVHQACPSTAQAAANLFRCEMAAGFLAALDALLRSLGAGWTFVLLAIVVFLAAVLLWVLEWKGMAWRQKRLVERHPGSSTTSTAGPLQEDPEAGTRMETGNDADKRESGAQESPEKTA